MSDNNKNGSIDLASILARLEAMEQRAIQAEQRATVAEQRVILPDASRQAEFVPGKHYFGFDCLIRPEDNNNVFRQFRVEQRTIVLVCGDIWHDGKKNHLVGPMFADLLPGVTNVWKQVKPAWDCPTMMAGSGTNSSKRKFPANQWETQTSIGRLFNLVDSDSSMDCENTRTILIDVESEYDRNDEFVGLTFCEPELSTGYGEGKFRDTVRQVCNSWFSQLDEYGSKASVKRSQSRRVRASHR